MNQQPETSDMKETTIGLLVWLGTMFCVMAPTRTKAPKMQQGQL
jgi:hypothetical protein